MGRQLARLTRREDRSAQLGRGPENLGNRAAAKYRFLTAQPRLPSKLGRSRNSFRLTDVDHWADTPQSENAGRYDRQRVCIEKAQPRGN